MIKTLKRVTSQLLAILIVMNIASCTFRGALFSFSETLSMMTLDKMFDLTSKQEEEMRPHVVSLIELLKNEPKRELLEILNGLKSHWADGLEQEEFTWFRSEVARWIKGLSPEVGKRFVILSASLTDEQLDHFGEYLNERNEKHEELLAAKDFYEERSEQIGDRIERWYGDVTSDQIKKAVSFTRTKEQIAAFVEQRKMSQKYTIELLKAHRTNKSKMLEFIEDLLTAPEKLRPEPYRKAYKNMMAEWNSVWVQTDQIMTEKQRKAAIVELDGWIADIREF